SSQATEASASSAGADLSKHHSNIAKGIARGKARRRSERLASSAVGNKIQSPPRRHGYNTRSQPTTRAELRSQTRRDKPKQKIRKGTSINLKRKGTHQLSSSSKSKAAERAQRREEGVQSLLKALADDNPLDDISFYMEKRLAIFFFLKLVYARG
ncbi:hypothetical protein FOZ63_016825, partial [Perkinsus olseni]